MAIKFTANDGLFYDVGIHDFVESDGALATVERVSKAQGIPVSEVEEWRQWLAERRAQRQSIDEKMIDS